MKMKTRLARLDLVASVSRLEWQLVWGFVDKPFGKAGTKLELEVRGKTHEIEICSMPLVAAEHYVLRSQMSIEFSGSAKRDCNGLFRYIGSRLDTSFQLFVPLSKCGVTVVKFYFS